MRFQGRFKALRNRLWIVVAAMLLLAACVPLQAAVQGVIVDFAKGDDSATMAITTTGVIFNPGDEPAEGVALYIGGHNLSTLPAACEVVRNGYGCNLGVVSEAVFIPVTGDNLSANVSYYRADNELKFFYVRSAEFQECLDDKPLDGC